MALFAIGDFHLSFQTPEKSMDVFGAAWRHHEEKITRNCEALVGPHDTLVITGDHSWGRKLPECEQDLAFIAALARRASRLKGPSISTAKVMSSAGMRNARRMPRNSLSASACGCAARSMQP